MEKLCLKIGSYNIANGGYVDHDLARLGEDIVATDLDIVGLQEVDIGTGRVKKQDTMKVLSECTGYKYHCFFKTIDFWGGDYGLGVLSKYPIVESERIKLSSGWHEQRVLGRVKVDVNGKLVNFFVTHLSYEDEDIRRGQFSQINAVLGQQDNFILTGDFNCDSLGEFGLIESSSAVNTDTYSLLTCGGACIDNIVYSENWSFSRPLTLDNGHSDHRLLYATGELLE